MEGLTAKVFRTYNASITLQEQLEELTLGKYMHVAAINQRCNDDVISSQMRTLFLQRFSRTTELIEQWLFSATTRWVEHH